MLGDGDGTVRGRAGRVKGTAETCRHRPRLLTGRGERPAAFVAGRRAGQHGRRAGDNTGGKETDVCRPTHYVAAGRELHRLRDVMRPTSGAARGKLGPCLFVKTGTLYT